MSNSSRTSPTFVLLGVEEMEKLKYVYSSLALALYVFLMFICTMIVYVSWTEETLHEPMYLLISHLVGNVMFGCSAFLPKLAIDLLSGSSTVTFSGCLIQAFCIQTFTCIEMCTLSIMAYDRYLAVGHPLRYHSLVTNRKALKLLAALWSFVSIVEAVSMILITRLTWCQVTISSAFCETMSMVRLACDDITLINVYGSVLSLCLVITCISVVVFCYIGTFIVCLTVSEANQKAIHMLGTHIITFSFTMSICIFVIFRYRLNGGSISPLAHIVISGTGLTSTLTLNPLIYGIRTEALRMKMIQNLYKVFQGHIKADRL